MLNITSDLAQCPVESCPIVFLVGCRSELLDDVLGDPDLPTSLDADVEGPPVVEAVEDFCPCRVLVL